MDIVTRFAEDAHNGIASLLGDFIILDLYYFLQNNEEKVKDLYNHICEVHEKLLSANGRLAIKEERLELNDDIESLSDMVSFQLNL
ncbi:hypothetical protein [Lachnobacterium bovis]|uniref:Uncharacterized protein n=1 Tax=Lachnobacterium bovis TaxID=140626 RepID=A0A1H9T846_9FIRM|nr:hypothetical protein [Lachnobacterium bovis]SER92929.1 hypothetical protein SAMN02910429_01515 [Lachnobacterium bovis]